MSRRITQRELRNDSERVMRALDKGSTFVVTRNDVAVGELAPLRHRRFVSTEVAIAAFSGAPKLSARRFRRDVDRVINPRDFDDLTGLLTIVAV